MEPSLIVALVSVCLSAIVGPICVLMVKHWFDQKDKKAQAEENQKKENQEKLNIAVAQMDCMRKGLIASLRNDMHTLYKSCKKAGVATVTEKANFHELYDAYVGLGGNSLKKFVDQWKITIENLPQE